MQEILFDNGLQEYRMPGGILRFNPKDPNLYQRFLDAGAEIEALEKKLIEGGAELKQNGPAEAQAVLRLMKEADGQVKAVLNRVFDAGNDFDALLNGVNVMAVANNGERVITNLLSALQPVLSQGAEACAASLVESAVREARDARARRSAGQ